MEEPNGIATGTASSTGTRKHAHVLLLTIEDEGHFTLFLQLLYYFNTLDNIIAVTICTSRRRVNQLQALQSKGDFDGLKRLRLVQLSDDASGPEPSIMEVPKIMKIQFQPFRQTLIEDTDPNNKLTCVIADAFLDWTEGLAEELRIARYVVFTGGSWLPYTYLRTRSDTSRDKSGSDTLDVPGYPPLLLKGVPSAVYDLLRLQNLGGILANSFEELEGKAIFDAMRDSLRHMTTKPGDSKIARVLPIGPMLLLPGYPRPCPDTHGDGHGSRRSKALEWLDEQAPASVVYVAFGSKPHVSRELIFEVARGLELIDVPFLWVLRGPMASSITDLTSILPPGFLDRVGKRVYVESGWAPQAQILQHASIGAFMSHCGWNSMIESIAAGVPILTWPLYADQPLNARFVVERLKVGLPVCKDMFERDPGFIARGEDVAAAVRLLMVGEKGQEVRKNSSRLKELAWNSMEEGGSSSNNLQQFTDDILA